MPDANIEAKLGDRQVQRLGQLLLEEIGRLITSVEDSIDRYYTDRLGAEGASMAVRNLLAKALSDLDELDEIGWPK